MVDSGLTEKWASARKPIAAEVNFKSALTLNFFENKCLSQQKISFWQVIVKYL